MASPRPYRTFYSDGTQGNSSTANGASLRALRKILEGEAKRAVVTNGDGKELVTVEKRYNAIQVTLVPAKKLRLVK